MGRLVGGQIGGVGGWVGGWIGGEGLVSGLAVAVVELLLLTRLQYQYM